jgi:hypothetical protein
VLFTDEATFGRHGITNFLNQHQWAEENPRGTFHARHQQHFRVNVWAGIVGDCLVGPRVLPRHTGNVCSDFFLNVLPRLLENVPLAVRVWVGRAMAQAVSRRPPTARPGFEPGSLHVGFVVDKVTLEQVFPPSTSVFPCHFHFTGAPLLGKVKKKIIFLIIFITRVAQ